jgi:hypothetical protein
MWRQVVDWAVARFLFADPGGDISELLEHHPFRVEITGIFGQGIGLA